MSKSKLAERAKTRSALVADELRRLIQNGELTGGTRLRQEELAEQFGMSPTPVREALATLAREGLVRHEPQRGAVVHPPSDADILENFELRLALEPLATRHAAGQISPESIAELVLLAERLNSCVCDAGRVGRATGYEDLDRAFHERIFAAAGRPQLAGMIASLRGAAAAYAHVRPREEFEVGRFTRLQQDHVDLIPALRDGYKAEAERLAAEHVRRTAVAPVGDGATSPRPVAWTMSA